MLKSRPLPDITRVSTIKILGETKPPLLVLTILAWFLKLFAPVFCQPLAHFFNLSLSSAFIPPQWKRAWISLVTKIINRKVQADFHADFRPISITPILSRIIKRLVVRSFFPLSSLTHQKLSPFPTSLPSVPPYTPLLPSSGFSTPFDWS